MKEFYSGKTCAGQGVVVNQETGRDVALVYDLADTPLLTASAAMLEVLRFYAGWGIDGPAHDEAIGEDGGERARRLLDEISNNIREFCPHEWQSDGTHSGGCVGLVCTRCGERDEKDVS